jgi:hypothetical protein
MISRRVRGLILITASAALAQQSRSPADGIFEEQKAIVLSNSNIELTVLEQGATIANLILKDDAEKLSPLWNPLRLAREAGRQNQFNGTLGHFVAVDGFGQPSAEERAAGLPQHGEAHMLHLAVTKDAAANSVSLSGKLPIAEEMFTRTFHVVEGEDVVYVDSTLENLLGFDRPVNWAEHATINAPFVAPGKTTIALSGTRSQNRDYAAEAAANPPGNPGNPGRGRAGGNGGQNQRRLAPGKDFTWPMAPGLDGQLVDLHIIPENPHFTDHAATLMDPLRELEWVTALNTEKHLVYGYIFRRSDYPWMQHWGNFPGVAQLVRGMEFGTQPYDFARHRSIAQNSMFDTPTYRWLPAKSKIESHFLLFYAHTPASFGQVDDVRMESGHIVVEDRHSNQKVTLNASRSL